MLEVKATHEQLRKQEDNESTLVGMTRRQVIDILISYYTIGSLVEECLVSFLD